MNVIFVPRKMAVKLFCQVYDVCKAGSCLKCLDWKIRVDRALAVGLE